jgi:hypothetical protein
MTKPTDRFGGSNRPIANETPGPAGGKIETRPMPPKPMPPKDKVMKVLIYGR